MLYSFMKPLCSPHDEDVLNSHLILGTNSLDGREETRLESQRVKVREKRLIENKKQSETEGDKQTKNKRFRRRQVNPVGTGLILSRGIQRFLLNTEINSDLVTVSDSHPW